MVDLMFYIRSSFNSSADCADYAFQMTQNLTTSSPHYCYPDLCHLPSPRFLFVCLFCKSLFILTLLRIWSDPVKLWELLLLFCPQLFYEKSQSLTYRPHNLTYFLLFSIQRNISLFIHTSKSSYVKKGIIFLSKL